MAPMTDGGGLDGRRNAMWRFPRKSIPEGSFDCGCGPIAKPGIFCAGHLSPSLWPRRATIHAGNVSQVVAGSAAEDARIAKPGTLLPRSAGRSIVCVVICMYVSAHPGIPVDIHRGTGKGSPLIWFPQPADQDWMAWGDEGVLGGFGVQRTGAQPK